MPLLRQAGRPPRPPVCSVQFPLLCASPSFLVVEQTLRPEGAPPPRTPGALHVRTELRPHEPRHTIHTHTHLTGVDVLECNNDAGVQGGAAPFCDFQCVLSGVHCLHCQTPPMSPPFCPTTASAVRFPATPSRPPSPMASDLASVLAEHPLSQPSSPDTQWPLSGTQSPVGLSPPRIGRLPQDLRSATPESAADQNPEDWLLSKSIPVGRRRSLRTGPRRRLSFSFLNRASD